MVGELLAEADPGACVEREEDEGVWDEVFLHSVIDEAVRVEFLSCKMESTGVQQRLARFSGRARD